MRRPAVAFCWNVERVRVLLVTLSRIVAHILVALPARRASSQRTLTREGLLFAALALSLCGCSGGSVIGLYAADYRDTTANAGDAQLLLNILRARDNLPIHFYDLSNIHGSIQWTAGVGDSAPFGLHNALDANLLTAALGAQNSPTFDLGTLDSQDFTKGMLSPIDPKVIKQLFDQGVDPRIMMLLFFSEYQTGKQHYLNNMSCDLTNPGKHPEYGCYSQVYYYLNKIDELFIEKGDGGRGPVSAITRRQLQANIYVVLKPVGGLLTGSWSLKDNLGDLRQLDNTKYKLIGTQLYSISEPRLAICFVKNHHLTPLFDDPGGEQACSKSEIIVTRSSTAGVALSVRSTYEIIQFLGQVLRFQEETVEPDRCLTLDADDRHCDTGTVLFQVNAPAGTPVVATRFGDRTYALYDRSCNKLFDQPCDYSLQVLAIVELLLNENKAAKDIIATPRVQVVP
jgi:hypothetical protein